MNEIITIMDGGIATSGTYLSEYAAWLKSLRPQPHWEPSEEQKEVLKLVVYNRPIGSVEHNRLESLYNELKKL